MRILAVDDDPVILDLLKEALTKQDQYDLVCVNDAEEAVALLQSNTHAFECFLFDIVLPGIDGIELCDVVRQMRDYRTTPIIMITSSRAPDLMERAFLAGATDYVSKPLNGVELGARINSAGMLNESLHRERDARHTLAELTQKMKLRFDEPILLETDGVTDLLSLENDMLRLPNGCYAMTMITIDVLGLRGIYKMVDTPAFRLHLEEVASAARKAFEGTSWKLAYVGSGRFIGVVMGRTRLSKEDLFGTMTAVLRSNWDEAAAGTPMPPTVRVKIVNDKRFWTGATASAEMRAQVTSNDVMNSIDETRQDNLFTQVEAYVA